MKDLGVYDHDHNRIDTVIWKAEIDEGILPIVKWLNSLSGIVTRWSCQGERVKNRWTSVPYVVIWVEQGNEVDKVQKWINEVNGAKVEKIGRRGYITAYSISFPQVGSLEEAIRYLINFKDCS